jgi:Tfp pilus tip-associated adhesin PilY1
VACVEWRINDPNKPARRQHTEHHTITRNESLRYITKKNGATPQYVSGVTAPMRDGFPVITTWDDPVQYSCQKNYAIMIADVNAWCDYALPGTQISSDNNCKTGSGPIHSSTISNPIPGLNVATEVNKVAALDTSVNWQSTARQRRASPIKHPITNNSTPRHTWHLAGLAPGEHEQLAPDLTK